MNVLFVAVNRNGGRKWHILRARLTTKVLNSNSYYYLLLVFFFSSLPHFCSCRYLNLVPSIPEINAPGINWTEEELNELKGSDILQQLLDYSKQVDRKFKGVAKHVSALSRWFMFCLLVCSFASFTLCLARPKHRLTLFAPPPPPPLPTGVGVVPRDFFERSLYAGTLSLGACDIRFTSDMVEWRRQFSANVGSSQLCRRTRFNPGTFYLVGRRDSIVRCHQR